MATWLARSMSTWWTSTVKTLVGSVDVDEGVWEPFLVNDDAPMPTHL